MKILHDDELSLVSGGNTKVGEVLLSGTQHNGGDVPTFDGGSAINGGAYAFGGLAYAYFKGGLSGEIDIVNNTFVITTP
ncbi:MAG: hypothetical protein K0Q74_725 [Gammaproteobacteria bacterium]|jgi:hypothetical protein|nr:hypothetical protein [Gammaproteobacteria bacterium]